jgi:preprotein translocase subunit YajC
MSSTLSIIILYVVIIGAFYLIAIRPQKKKEKEHQALINGVAVGDSILTTSGFYGVVIDMTEDVVIVEFGSNKNCRIPMQKGAIVEVEKAEQ